jgi:hypothetical protein
MGEACSTHGAERNDLCAKARRKETTSKTKS